MEAVADFFFLGSKITANGDYSHEIRRQLLLGAEVMINLDSMLKSKDITLPTKVPILKAMVFPVIMYRHESWAVKKAERVEAGIAFLFLGSKITVDGDFSQEIRRHCFLE